MESTVYKHLVVAIAAGVTLGLATPVFADSPAQPQGAMQHDGAQHGAQHHGWKHQHSRHHRWHKRAWPFANALHELDLSDAQKKAIHEDLQSSRKAIHQHMRGLRAERMAFLSAIPGTPAFNSAYEKYAQDAALATQARIQQIATLHVNIYNKLTHQQRQQLARNLAKQATEDATKRAGHRNDTDTDTDD